MAKKLWIFSYVLSKIHTTINFYLSVTNPYFLVTILVIHYELHTVHQNLKLLKRSHRSSITLTSIFWYLNIRSACVASDYEMCWLVSINFSKLDTGKYVFSNQFHLLAVNLIQTLFNTSLGLRFIRDLIVWHIYLLLNQLTLY